NRHVGQNLLVETDFALDPTRGLRLAPIKSSCEDGRDQRARNQPPRRDRDFTQQIMHRCISDFLRLPDDCKPLRRLQRLERVNVAVPGKMATLLLLNMGNEFRFLRGRWFGLRFEVGCEKRETLLIDNLADSPVCERNRGETSTNPFGQNRSADITDGFAIARSHCAHNISNHPAVEWPLVDGRNVGAGSSVGTVFPNMRMEWLTS